VVLSSSGSKYWTKIQQTHNSLFISAAISSEEIQNYLARSVIWAQHAELTEIRRNISYLRSYLEACICRPIQKWRRYEVAFHASSYPCTSRWCSRSIWGGFCMDLWPHRRVLSTSAQRQEENVMLNWYLNYVLNHSL